VCCGAPHGGGCRDAQAELLAELEGELFDLRDQLGQAQGGGRGDVPNSLCVACMHVRATSAVCVCLPRLCARADAAAKAEALEGSLASSKDQLLRLTADFENFRKRTVSAARRAGARECCSAHAGAGVSPSCSDA
jgi:hypothetical protein